MLHGQTLSSQPGLIIDKVWWHLQKGRDSRCSPCSPSRIGIAQMFRSSISCISIVASAQGTILNQPVVHLLLIELLGCKFRAKLGVRITIRRRLLLAGRRNLGE